jgi:hypothetical protein
MLPDPAAYSHNVTGEHIGDSSALRPSKGDSCVRAGKFLLWWRGGDGAADIRDLKPGDSPSSQRVEPSC